MGNFLDAAKQEKETHVIKTTTGLDAAATGMQGWRLEMEVMLSAFMLTFNNLLF